MKVRVEDGKIYLSFDYNEGFIKSIKQMGGRWNSDKSEWSLDEELLDRAEEMAIRYTGLSFNKHDRVKIKYLAIDFKDNGKIKIGDAIMVERRYRDSNVSFKCNTVVIDGDEFPERGGSVKYPDVNCSENCLLQSVVSMELLDFISDDMRKKIEVVEDSSRKEILIKKKFELETQLNKVNTELAQLEKSLN